jgi:hypothetical protein
MSHDERIKQAEERLERLRYEIIDLEQIMLLLIGVNSRNRKELRQF